MVEIDNLKKKYGGKEALKGISFTADDGEILGLLGPNGAGKSTTMNIITGFITDYEGEVRLDGIRLHEQPAKYKRQIGYLPEMNPLPYNMTVSEFLEFAAGLKGIEKRKVPEELDRVLEATGLTQVRNRLIRNLSKGYKQRTGIAQALVGSPKLLILDEPTVGLDPKQLADIRNLIRSLANEHTVIFSSHILTEVNAVCDNVVIMKQGTVLAHASPEELARKLKRSETIHIRLEDGADAAESIFGKMNFLTEYQRLEQTDGEKDERSYVLKTEDKDACKKIFLAFADRRIPILSMTPEEFTLEDAFLELISTSGQEET